MGLFHHSVCVCVYMFILLVIGMDLHNALWSNVEPHQRTAILSP